MINQRLLAIASMMQPGNTVADIGSDHAKLPVYLIKQDKFKKAYACDVATGPLHSAKETIEKENLEKVITCVLSNGFENVPNDIDSAVIAGMGFYTAKQILLDAEKDGRLDTLDQIIVQVNADVDLFREFISEKGWTIQDEVLVQDRKHFYTIISFQTKHHAPYSKEEIIVGPILIQKKGDVFYDYVALNLQKCEMILKKRNRNDDKQEFFKQRYDLWNEILKSRD